MVLLSPQLVRREAAVGLSGVLPGLGATSVMTFFMLLGHHLGARSVQEPVPPKRITERVARRVGLRRHIDQDRLTALSIMAHFGYGSFFAVVYRMTVGRLTRQPAVGALFGLALWAAGYLGYLPRLGLYPSAGDRPKGRVAVVAGSHLVWGAALALFSRMPTGRPGFPSLQGFWVRSTAQGHR